MQPLQRHGGINTLKHIAKLRFSELVTNPRGGHFYKTVMSQVGRGRPESALSHIYMQPAQWWCQQEMPPAAQLGDDPGGDVTQATEVFAFNMLHFASALL